MKELLADLRRAADWHRRLLVAALAAGSIALTIEALEAPAPPTTAVLAAARDLPGGTKLDDSALAEVRLPPDAVPAGAAPRRRDLVGRVLAGPVRAGEPITDVRLVGPSLVEHWGRGLVATPIRVADPGVARLIRAGDRIDVLAAAIAPLDVPESIAAAAHQLTPAEIVVRNVPVLAVPDFSEQAGFTEGALVLVATTPAAAQVLATAAVTSRLSVTIRAFEQTWSLDQH